MVRAISAVAALAACAALFSVPARARGGGSLVMIWDARQTSQVGQLTIYNDDPEGSGLGEPVGSGDVNGDGYADVVTCAFVAPAGPSNGRQAAGKLHLWFGGPDALRGGVVYDAANPTAPTVEIWGARAGDFLGAEVDVGDVNGDGFADILACAPNADGFGAAADRPGAGVLYVVLGRAEWAGPIDLAASPDGVVEILGARPNDRCGFWATSGDVDDDGVRDVLVAADLVRGPSGAASGAVYVVPGRADLPARVDLGDAASNASLGVTAIYGLDDGDHFGASIASGDFDGDGVADVAIGAGLARAGAVGAPQGSADGPDDSRTDAGEAYVVFGRADWPATVQVTDPPAGDVSIFYGDQPGGAFGEDVRAGDVDGDGRDELGVGALVADAPGRGNAGIGYVFWSGSIRRGARVDARTAGAGELTQIYGQAAGDIGADSILLADVDGDGLADVLFGSPTNSPPGRSSGGDLKVIYGSPEPLPAVVDTASPPAGLTIYRVIPPDPGDLFTYSIAVGDVDGDGVLDLVPNAMGGDGADNRFPDAGDAYVISGRELAARAGRGASEVPALSRVVVSPELPTYYAGQPGVVLTLLSDVDDPDLQFKPGAVAIVRGVEVPTEFVGPTELRVRLDDAPDVRNAPGPLVVQVRNPGSDPSAPVNSVTLVGPTIRRVKVVRGGGAYTIKVKGADFLEGATVEVKNAAGAVVPVLSVERRNERTLRARVARDAVARRETLTVRAVNPGPAPSEPAAARVP